ncbi:MAG TPA: hypothetical protein VN442_06390 [Bryobacteraceae bacterium]|nr:hypothetical protein [Bryobacteraceae bacterium]
MPVYSGKYRYLSESGGCLSQGPCRLSFDPETCIVTPEAGAALAFDLGDIDRVVPGELDLALTLYTGRVLELRGFGKVFAAMSDGLLAAWRDRIVRCLLLEDLEESTRFSGAAALSGKQPQRAQIRLYGSNLAVIPETGAPLNWRLGDVDSVRFDEASYSVAINSGSEQLVVSKLARKTDEFVGMVQDALDTLRTQAAAELHKLFPFLGPDPLERLLTVMPEGRSVRLAELAAIHPKLSAAFLARAVDGPLKPYFEALRSGVEGDSLMAGFKFLREEDAQAAEAEAPEAEAAEEPETAPQEEPEAPEGEEEERQPVLFWFLFPMAKNVVAWEAGTGSGRATYFFRLVARGQEASLQNPAVVEAAVASITRGLALVNFRREPVYLPDSSLEEQPRYRRYAIACRKLPELRELRARMLGRAIHSSLDAWRAQVKSITGA